MSEFGSLVSELETVL